MLLEFLNLGIDLIVFGILLKLYRERESNLEELRKAPVFSVDPSLGRNLEAGSVPYAVVRGTVLAAGASLRSRYVAGLSGVIQENIIREHKTWWSPWSHFWCDLENDIKRSTNAVPFFLSDDSWWKNTVEVRDINQIEKLPLSVVYDRFTPNESSAGNIFLGWLNGEQPRGLQEIERMLLEGTRVTGIGRLEVGTKGLQLVAPGGGLGYFLTLLTPEELIEKMEKEVQSLKSYATIFGCLGLFMASWFFMSWQARRRRESDKLALQERMAEARRRRRMAEQEAKKRGDTVCTSNQPLCVICMVHPVELLVLECGHACMCLDCGEQIGDNCPMCRAPIIRTVPAFLP